jgi:GNAT superfamily N-acetyltransferase
MARQSAAQKTPANGAYLNSSPATIVVRRFDPTLDSLEELTVMLRGCFARLGGMGLNCTCVDQTVETTRERIARGDCYVAVGNGRIIGTMTLCGHDDDSPCELYRCADIASLHQFAVALDAQNAGIGTALLAVAEQWAAARGYSELALDTPWPAAHLLAFYRARGFRIVDMVEFSGKHYDSAILTKRVSAGRDSEVFYRNSPPAAEIARVA